VGRYRLGSGGTRAGHNGLLGGQAPRWRL